MLRNRYLVLLGLMLLVTGCTSCGGGPSKPATPAPTFDGARAFADLSKQCSYGPRTPGSTAHDDCLAWLKTQFPGADKVVNQEFSSKTPFGGPYPFTNVMALYGAAKPGLPFLICSHWDSRPVADQDPTAANRSKPVMGANDGASGVGVILEIARLLQATAPPRPVILCLLDAEDSGKSGSAFNAYQGFCIGADYLAQHWPDGLPKPAEGALLDMVGRGDLPNARLAAAIPSAKAYLNLPIEGYSFDTNPTLVNALWTIAEQRGHLAFKRTVAGSVTDDHVALQAGGIKCIDLIQFAPPEWHTVDDTPEYCSAAALNQSGDTLVQYLYQ